MEQLPRQARPRMCTWPAGPTGGRWPGAPFSRRAGPIERCGQKPTLGSTCPSGSSWMVGWVTA